MKHIDARLPTLKDGYYMCYIPKSFGRRIIFIFEISGNLIHLMYVITRSRPSLSVRMSVSEVFNSATVDRSNLNPTREFLVFELTEEEYLLETAGAV